MNVTSFEEQLAGLNVPVVDVQECVLLSKEEYDRLKAVKRAPGRIDLCRLLKAYDKQCEERNKRRLTLQEMKELVEKFPELWS